MNINKSSIPKVLILKHRSKWTHLETFIYKYLFLNEHVLYKNFVIHGQSSIDNNFTFYDINKSLHSRVTLIYLSINIHTYLCNKAVTKMSNEKFKKFSNVIIKFWN